MFQQTKVSPSILSADFMHLDDEVKSIEHAGADWVHVDVMDGHFVPNLTIGVPVLKQLRAITQLPLDVHLMISNPKEQLPWFIECNPDIVTVHLEALDDPFADAHEIADALHSKGMLCGISIKPDTPVEALASTLSVWDMVLVMSVYPGFSGQSYIPETQGRVGQLANMCKQAGVSPLIQVDGGINDKTASLVAAAGADSLVAGNAVFKAESREQAIASIRQAADGAQTQRNAR